MAVYFGAIMDKHPIFQKYPELKEFVSILRFEIQQVQRPPDQSILDDQDVMKLLKISKRKLQYLKSNLEIPFHHPDSGNRSYYLLSDLLEWLKKSRVESLSNDIKIKQL